MRNGQDEILRRRRRRHHRWKNCLALSIKASYVYDHSMDEISKN